ncbi:MAG: DUF2169 domain-containing protein [Planctomycetota bacterium]
MLQLENRSPFEAAITVFPDEAGVDTLYVVVKGTFELGSRLSIAKVQLPPTMADEYWGEPGASSLKYASDMHLSKKATDVVLVGSAWAPTGKKVTELDVSLEVANKKKPVRVFGNRYFKRGFLGSSVSRPEPFESMPLVYERAFGGVHEFDTQRNKVLAESRNPVGAGFRGKRKSKELAGRPLPNLEDPACLVEKAGDKARPAAFGFVAPSWQPRLSYAGTYDEAWQKSRAPYLPKDFDPRFFNAAHPDLVCDGYLEGGEPVRIENASRNGLLEFTLPGCRLGIEVRIAGRSEKPEPKLETVLIEPDENRLSLVWRASLACDKQTLKVEQVTIDSRNTMGATT